MISLLTPTRGRPANMLRLCKSVEETACNPNDIEIVFYIDIDDTKSKEQFHEICDAGFATNVYACIGKRILLSRTWNTCFEISEGPHYMLCADNIVFRTKNWDTMVLDKFAEFPDKIVLIYGRDNPDVHSSPLVIYPFLHKRWVDTVGYFCPPYFPSGYNNKWLTAIADTIKRRELLPNLLTECIHPAIIDITHIDGIKRGKRDNVGKIWRESATLIRADAYKLLQVIGWNR